MFWESVVFRSRILKYNREKGSFILFLKSELKGGFKYSFLVYIIFIKIVVGFLQIFGYFNNMNITVILSLNICKKIFEIYYYILYYYLVSFVFLCLLEI